MHILKTIFMLISGPPRVRVDATSRHPKSLRWQVMYGKSSYKVSFFNDKCNLHCGLMRLAVTPRNKIEALF
ncbi:hypothetical protein SFRURICE_017418 [Spodoptera frugiperda]|nr:hypothetical protein SFRURICE_017418 [Spodoptera frugiperda]